MVTASLWFLLWLVSPVELTVVNVPVRGSVDLQMIPAGKAEIARTGSFSRIRIELDRVGPPANLAAGMNTYVAWAVTPEGRFENMGELPLAEGRARFDGMTMLDHFGILVTAEPHYLVEEPSSYLAYRNEAPRDQRIRRSSATVNIGRYDYSKLQAAAPAAVNVASQARTAYDLARAEGADRLAESELRFARVALDTMEEMLSRAAPAEIVVPSANEAIRLAHRALILARERATANQLADARNQAASLGRERTDLTARLDQVTRDQAAATQRIQQLQTRVNELTTEGERVTSQRADALARLQAAERELAELRQKAAQVLTVIRIPDEYVDVSKNQVTPAGRDALSKIVATANLWSGQLRIEGSSASVEVAKKFLSDAGLPADRIVLLTQD